MKAKSAPSSSLPLLDVSLQGKGRGHLAASAPLSLQLPGGASWGRGRQGDPKEVLSRGLGAGWPLRRGRPPSAGLQRHYRAGAHRASRRMCRPGPAPDSAPALLAEPSGPGSVGLRGWGRGQGLTWPQPSEATPGQGCLGPSLRLHLWSRRVSPQTSSSSLRPSLGFKRVCSLPLGSTGY